MPTVQKKTDEAETDDDASKGTDGAQTDIEARLDRLEALIRRVVGGDGAAKSTKPQTRAEKEEDIGGKIQDEVKKLRDAEKDDESRHRLEEKLKELDEKLKKEKPPEVFSAISKFMFGGLSRKAAD